MQECLYLDQESGGPVVVTLLLRLVSYCNLGFFLHLLDYINSSKQDP